MVMMMTMLMKMSSFIMIAENKWSGVSDLKVDVDVAICDFIHP